MRGAILASFWHVPGMAADSGTPTDWLTALSGALVTVHCECPPSIAAERFLRRTRHAGHLDATRSAADVHAGFAALPSRPLPGTLHLTIDTTQAVDIGALARELERVLER